ncbi:MAG: hypothetical protein E7K05_10645 [Serratia marcescens]|nr:hypothetical protein [Serratia marcescens]
MNAHACSFGSKLSSRKLPGACGLPPRTSRWALALTTVSARSPPLICASG